MSPKRNLVEIPLRQGADAENAGSNEESYRIVAPKTILVLEDDPSVMKLMCHILKHYTLIAAISAEHALRLFIDHGRQVDLLIADVTLPTSSGIKVALILRAELRRLPVILTSGYPVSGWNGPDSGDLSRLGTTGLAIIQKPFRTDVLLNTVCELTGTALSTAARTVTPHGHDNSSLSQPIG